MVSACKKVEGEKDAALQEVIGWAGKGKATPGMDCALQNRMDEPNKVGGDRSAPYGGLCLAVVGGFYFISSARLFATFISWLCYSTCIFC